MQIKSTSFENNQPLPSKYTCDGEGINPPLQILDIPKGTKSLALISDDPDAPSGDFVHWLVWNINPGTSDPSGVFGAEIAEGSVPGGAIEGMTDYGKIGYGVPCPPSGEHRYFFKIYALDINLNLTPNTKKPDLENAMVGHIIDKAEIIGLYSRQ